MSNLEQVLEKLCSQCFPVPGIGEYSGFVIDKDGIAILEDIHHGIGQFNAGNPGAAGHPAIASSPGIGSDGIDIDGEVKD